jgi:amidase
VALADLADRLAKQGCRVMRRHPDMPELARTTRNYSELLAASFSAGLTPRDRAGAQAIADALSPDDLSLNAAWIRGTTMSHAAWGKTQGIRNGLRVRWQALLREIDLVLCPPMPTVAFPHDHTPQRGRKLAIDGKKVDYEDQIAWSAVATSMGLPATVAPIARNDDGLPVGVQIIGGYLQDRTTIAFAGMLEQAFGGFVPPPRPG